LLQSKLALIELDMGRAKKLLEKAFTIAEEKGLTMLARAIAHERDSLLAQMRKWERITDQKPSRQEMVDLIGLDGFLELMVQKTVSSLASEDEKTAGDRAPEGKYEVTRLDLLKDPSRTERSSFRVGIAQIGLSKKGDILHEFYEPHSPGLFRIIEDKIESVRAKVKDMVELAHSEEISVLLFPEMTVDLGYEPLRKDLLAHAKAYKMFIIPGSYHDPKTKRNLSLVISPDGVLWEQEKHIPAIISYKGERIKEGITTASPPRKTLIGDTEFGRIAITICRDFLDMDLRVELKNSDPAVDIVLNPSFTPVTAAFRAAHFDARRTIYAYCFFANIAEFGDSFIYSPEKDRVERTIAKGEEKLIYKEIDLFRLRSERRKWEIERKREKPFIQSTR
jgi:predicted amidohydrolase